MTSRFRIADWRAQAKRAASNHAKRIIYGVARPLLELAPRRALSDAFRSRIGPCHTLFDRGLPLESRRRRAVRRMDVGASTILIQGTGSGWDVVSWAMLRPRRILAVDLTEFAESWEQVARHCRDQLKVPVEFRAAPLEDLSFIGSGQVDLCASDAVLEHCTDLPAVLEESRRVLGDTGRFYAAYGPLWWSAGGDHYSGRGGLSEAYNHLVLDPADYRRYFERHLADDEDFQSGGRYVEIDLFSRLSTFEYFAAFDRAGLQRDETWLFVSRNALEFRRRYPARWEALLSRLPPHLVEDDLLVTGHVVYLRPRA